MLVKCRICRGLFGARRCQCNHQCFLFSFFLACNYRQARGPAGERHAPCKRAGLPPEVCSVELPTGESLETAPVPLSAEDGGAAPLDDADLAAHFDGLAAFIDAARKEPRGCVYVHCGAGISRGPTVCIAYLMASARPPLPFADAHRLVAAARPSVQPNPGFMRQLRQYEAVLARRYCDADRR